MKHVRSEQEFTRHGREELKDKLFVILAGLDERRLMTVLDFVNEVVTCNDPDVVDEFVEWREDPMIGSILQIAATISRETREQLLFAAEELFSSESVHH